MLAICLFFCSDQIYYYYVGTLGDSNRLFIADAGEIQKRKYTRIALKLTNMFKARVKDDANILQVCICQWEKEVKEISLHSYGCGVVHLRGHC